MYALHRGIRHVSFTAHIRIHKYIENMADPKQVLVWLGVSNRVVSLSSDKDLVWTH